MLILEFRCSNTPDSAHEVHMQCVADESKQVCYSREHTPPNTKSLQDQTPVDRPAATDFAAIWLSVCVFMLMYSRSNQRNECCFSKNFAGESKKNPSFKYSKGSPNFRIFLLA